MNTMPNWSLGHAFESVDAPFSLFARRSLDFERRDDRPRQPARPQRHASKPFARLLGTLSLADLNEYREAAGREPDLDAKALYALHDAADRFFPVRNDETGGRYLRNTYLRYLSEHASLAEILSDGGAGLSSVRRPFAL